MTSVAHLQNATTAANQGAGVAPNITPVVGGKLGVPDRPQVNLLPAEVTHRRQVAAAQRRLVWSIFATILVIAMAFGGAFLVRADANLQLEEALGEADQLLQQRREYSPVLEVMESITSTQLARAYVLSTEVNWPAYVYALAAVLPDDVVINSINITSAGAGGDLVAGADELTTNAIGVITFEGTSPDLPVASEWIDAIESIPGLADANVQSAELSDADGEEYYEVAATIQVTLDAAAHRTFSDMEETDVAAGTGGTEADADAEGGE